MKKIIPILCVLFAITLTNGLHAQRTVGGTALVLDNDATHHITIQPPPGLINSYVWTLPLNAPPDNTAFSEAGTLTGQMLRWDNTLGYWVATSALFAAGNGPGSFVGIGTTSPTRLLEVAGTSGTPNVRIQSLGGTANWGTAITNTDGFVFANNSGDLLKRDPLTVLNQFSWLVGGNTNPGSTILGTLTNQPLEIRTNSTSRMLFATNGNIAMGNAAVPSQLTIEPGAGGNLVVNNVAADNTSSLFLTVDGSNRVRTRTLSSILSVTANEGLVYDSPNIKLGATDGATNPFVVNRFVNLNNNTLTFTHNAGASNLLVLQGSNGSLGVGAVPNNFKVEVAGHVGPAVNNSYTLGSNTLRWKDVFVGPNSLHIGNGAGDQVTLSYTNSGGVKKFNVDPDDDGDIQMNVDGTGNLEFSGALEPNNSAGTSGQYLKSSGANTPPIWASITTSAWGISGNSGTDSTINFVGTTDNRDLVFRTNNIARARFRNATFDDDSGAFEPYLSNAYSLGSPTHRWRDAYFGPSSLRIGGFISGNKSGQQPQAVDEVTISYSNGTLIIDKPLGSTGSMVPNNTDIYTLGTTTSRWKDLFLGPSSLHIGADTLEAKISYEPSVGELRFNTNGTGATEITMYSNGNLAIANLSAGGLVKAAAGTGILSVASGGSDFESPLTFTNGLTRTSNTIKLGGALTAATDIPLSGSNLTFSGLGRVGIGTLAPANKFAVGASSQFQVDSFGTIAAATGITSSGAIQFTGLASGIVKSTSGTLGIATAGTDYEPALAFTNGLTRTANTIKLGGALSAATDIPLAGFNLTFSGLGNVGIGDATPASPLTVGAGDLFQVDAAGDLIKIKNVTYGWPAANAAGVLTNNGTGTLSWAAPAGSSPAGSNTQVQYNNSGSFGASSNFTYDGTTLALTSTGNALNATTSSTTDEQYAVHGNATGSTANQAVGVWGNASTDAIANTGTIGVLATGSGRTTAGETNVALQVNDGEFTMGRTTQAAGTPASPAGTSALANAAAGGTAYTAEGPSGVVSISFTTPFTVVKMQNEPAGLVTINNRYATASSIILVEIMDATVSSGTASDAAFSTHVVSRAAGSFQVRVNVHNGSATNFDLSGYKIGYMILNPSK